MSAIHKLLVISCILFSIRVSSYAKDAPKYPVSAISDELLKNANAVVRQHNTTIEILSSSKLKGTCTYAITILKEGAIGESQLSLPYNKINGVSGIDGTIYDASGAKVKKIKIDDIKDMSAIDNSTLYSDERLKYIDPQYYAYPFTIEYSYSFDYGSLFYLPSWNAFYGYNISVAETNFSVAVPNSYVLRYYEINTKEKTEQQDGGKTIRYSWKAENIKAINSEPFSPFISELYPTVKLAPSEFEMDGIKGSLLSWNDLGIFMNKLIAGRERLPESTVSEIKSMTKGLSDEKEIIRKVYEYGQKKNRYISVQEGIGGWQPFDAETVDRLSYGDCKALSNYTLALLKAAGIDAHYTRIYAGDTPYSAPADFPMNQFNHVVLCVPCTNDTVWLECTNPHAPCGYIGSFTDDRYAFIVTENGGKYIKTPSYSVEQNREWTTAAIQIKEQGALHLTASTSSQGTNYEDVYSLLYQDEKDRRKRIINSIHIPNFNLVDYSLSDNRNAEPLFIKKFEVEATNYWTQMGDKIILKLNLLNALESVPPTIRNRQSPVVISRNYSECDTLIYQMPENMQVAALPEKTVINSEYGNYSGEAKAEGNKVIYYRYFQINKGSYPKENYESFREFLEKIATADMAKAMLKKKEI